MEGTRKLAHVEKIEWIKPIKGADKIELCGILGWQCIIAKDDNLKVGDDIIYCEIDSVMPDKPEFQFLKDRKFRVKTIKLRGEISQGLVLPLSLLTDKHSGTFKIGQDVTELMEITKYLSPAERAEIRDLEWKLSRDRNKLRKFMMRYSWFRRLFLSRTKKEGFPYWVSKTDEERIQNMPHVLEQFANRQAYVTEKIDGQSVTFTGKMVPRFKGLLGKVIPLKKYQFVVCSRNLTVSNKKSLYWEMAEKYNIEQALRRFPNLTIQGEQIGPKIQGNKYGLNEHILLVFNIIDHEKGYHYNHREMRAFCRSYCPGNIYINSLACVPFTNMEDGIHHLPELDELGSTVQEIVELSKGRSQLANIPREGIVIRCIENGKKVLSFKCINPDFLLKYE